MVGEAAAAFPLGPPVSDRQWTTGVYPDRTRVTPTTAPENGKTTTCTTSSSNISSSTSGTDSPGTTGADTGLIMADRTATPTICRSTSTHLSTRDPNQGWVLHVLLYCLNWWLLIKKKHKIKQDAGVAGCGSGRNELHEQCRNYAFCLE